MTPIVWLISALAVGLMGFAIQRGGTCTVAAVSELIDKRRAHRLAAMLEASLWVAGGLALAQLLGIAGSMPASLELDRWTFIGGALLGLGAWLTGACVFGVIARLGSGDWACALSPVGFYVGCLSVGPLFARSAPINQAAPSPLFAATMVFGPLFLVYALWRVAPALAALRQRNGLAALRERVWAPHAATIVIGVSFVITLLLAGRWAYTDLLADLARDMARSLGGPILLFAALLTGAMLGGWTAGRWRHLPPSLPQLLRCFGGGVLMGWGSLLIPGSNDGLILIGIPLLQLHAWFAFATMCASIAIALAVTRAWAARARSIRRV
jgi:hypothetical protein